MPYTPDQQTQIRNEIFDRVTRHWFDRPDKPAPTRPPPEPADPALTAELERLDKLLALDPTARARQVSPGVYVTWQTA